MTDDLTQQNAAQADYEARILAALNLTATPVDASPASDPVSKTPTLDAMAMQRAAIDQMGQMFRAGVSPEKWPDYIAAITLPAADALAEALALPEVKTLIDWIEAATRDTFDLPLSFDAWPEMTVGDIQDQLAKLRENADAALKGAAE